ncbi:MAG: hypothetical protein KDE19_06630 [Caldilineaceae bacterium]|nr:hypothetical protein [Caldilineaceae bacterium]
MKQSDLLSAGKLPTTLLTELLQMLPIDDPQLVLGPAVGEDAAVIQLNHEGETLLVAKSDPITFATDEIGYYAVNVCANDLAVTGATPRFYLPTVLLPAGSTTTTMVADIFRQISDACRALNITVAGGHSEITHSVTQPVVAGTLLGTVTRSMLVSTAGTHPGDLILMAGTAPVEGISIIARERAAELHRSGWSTQEVAEAANYLYAPGISVLEPALLAAQTGVVTAMHDPTEGGIATGLHELATAASVGLEVDLDQIPIAPPALRMCQQFGLDPLGTIASGSLLATVPADYVNTILSVWNAQGWRATVIGRVTEQPAGLIGLRQGQRSALPTFAADEITKLWA